jgi:hypothetical protein
MHMYFSFFLLFKAIAGEEGGQQLFVHSKRRAGRSFLTRPCSLTECVIREGLCVIVGVPARSPGKCKGTGRQPSKGLDISHNKHLRQIAVLHCKKTCFSVRKRMRSGRAISTLRRGAVAGVAAAPAPLGVCATGRGVASPPLLLVATIVLLRVKGCEEGSKSAVAGFRHAESVLPPRY